MKVLSSLASAKRRHADCQVVKRKGTVYVILQIQPEIQAAKARPQAPASRRRVYDRLMSGSAHRCGFNNLSKAACGSLFCSMAWSVRPIACQPWRLNNAAPMQSMMSDHMLMACCSSRRRFRLHACAKTPPPAGSACHGGNRPPHRAPLSLVSFSTELGKPPQRNPLVPVNPADDQLVRPPGNRSNAAAFPQAADTTPPPHRGLISSVVAASGNEGNTSLTR